MDNKDTNKKITILDKIKKHLKYKEMRNYLIFGVLTTAVNWIVFQLVNAVFMQHWSYANVIAWIVAVLFAYITNRKYVFNSQSRNILKELFMFVQFRIYSLLLEMLMMYVFIEILLLTPFTAKVIAAIVVVIANYIFSKAIVFKESRSVHGSN